MGDPIPPEVAREMLRIIDEMEAKSELAEADLPHVCISSWVEDGERHFGGVVGPFPDLWAALAFAPVFKEQLQGDSSDEYDVTVLPLSIPKHMKEE